LSGSNFGQEAHEKDNGVAVGGLIQWSNSLPEDTAYEELEKI
jgi:hypothetical protein